MDAPQLDQLASLARTSLTDPDGLPDDEWQQTTWGGVPNRYAVEKLDEIINTLSPSEWTRARAVLALRVLGRHVAEVQDALRGLSDANVPETEDMPALAAANLECALDEVDAAIRWLENEDDDS